MGRSDLVDHDLIAVSMLDAETALNTERDPDTCMLVEKTTMADLDPLREDDSNELTGTEEPTKVYNRGARSALAFSFPKAMAHHFGFALGYGLGAVSTTSAGTGYIHTITPRTDPRDHPSFTAVQRYGDIVGKRRFGSMLIDAVRATFAKDDWAKLAADAKGTGKYTDQVTTETVTAAYNATSLTLAANGVLGADAAERLQNVQAIEVQVPTTNEWKPVVYSAVDAATPAGITITAPGGTTDSVAYRITYLPSSPPTWCTMPSYIQETPMLTTDLSISIGGKWDGSNYLGGTTFQNEVESAGYTLQNNFQIEGRPGGTGAYANSVFRQGRVQTVTLDKELRDWITQRRIIGDEEFALRLRLVGEEYATGENYEVDMVFPKCMVLKSPVKANGRRLGETGDYRIFEDATYGSAIVKVRNQVATIAA